MPDSRPLESVRPTLWRLGIVLILIPVGVLLALGVVGAIDGYLQTDCQTGFFSACGPKERALAYVVFIGTFVLGLYFVVVAVVLGYAAVRRLARSTWRILGASRRPDSKS